MVVQPTVPIEPAADSIDSSFLQHGALCQLSQAHCVLLSALSAQGFMIFFMSVLTQPLIWAPVSGLHVIGAELPLALSPSAVALPIMERWADRACLRRKAPSALNAQPLVLK